MGEFDALFDGVFVDAIVGYVSALVSAADGKLLGVLLILY